MSAAANKTLVRKFFEAGNRGEVERMFSMMVDDITWTDIGSHRFAGTYRGKDALGAQLFGPLMGSFKAGLHGEIDRLIAEDDMVVVQVRGTAELHDGTPYNNTYCHVIRIADGRIAEVTEYMDTALIDAVFGPRDH